jgi:hypothetical protein
VTGSGPATRRSTVPRDGTRRPRTSHSRAISRHTDATVRRCRVRYRARSTSRTTASASSGSRPPPRPPLEVPGSRSGARPPPARHRPVSTDTRRRYTRSPAAAASAAARPAVDCPVTSARRTARSRLSAATVRTPRSTTAVPSPYRRADEYRTNPTVAQAASRHPGNPKSPARDHRCPGHSCRLPRPLQASLTPLSLS